MKLSLKQKVGRIGSFWLTTNNVTATQWRYAGWLKRRGDRTVGSSQSPLATSIHRFNGVQTLPEQILSEFRFGTQVTTKDKITDAAIYQFCHDGYRADMKAIAKLSGVGVSTLYDHFHDKEALAYTALLRWVSYYRVHVFDVIARCESAQQCYQFFPTLKHYLMESSHGYPDWLVSQLLLANKPKFTEEIRCYHQAWRQALQRVLAHCGVQESQQKMAERCWSQWLGAFTLSRIHEHDQYMAQAWDEFSYLCRYVK